MNIPDNLIHYYKNKDFLFKTITDLTESELKKALTEISIENTWYGHRYSPENREWYLKYRIQLEKHLFEIFSVRYHKPSFKNPVYMYLSTKTAEERIKGLSNTSYADNKYISVKLSEIEDQSSLSFTVGDSMWSFGFDFFRKGISKLNPAEEITEKEYHGKLFHITELSQVIENHNLDHNQNFEIQIWDRSILNKFRK